MIQPASDVAALDERLASIVRDHRVTMVSTVAAPTTSPVAQLHRYGARRPLVIAHGPGLCETTSAGPLQPDRR